MPVSLVLTILGPDRPGLLEMVSATVAQHGGNWLESRMAHLGGQFAGVLRLAVAPEQEPGLTQALGRLTSQGLSVVIHPDPTSASPPPLQPALLEVVGHDRPGIIRQLSAALARHGVNVEELETGCESAPMTGDVLFRARAQLFVPVTCPVSALRSELERIAGDLMVDLTFRSGAEVPPGSGAEDSRTVPQKER